MRPKLARSHVAVAALAVLAGLAAEAAAAGQGPRTQLVSRQSANAGGAGGDGAAFNPAISGNGRYVAFETEADNLGGPLDTTVTNIYVYDRERKKVELVSRRSGRNGAGADGSSFNPEISADGRYVAFQTVADNLGGPLDTNVDNIYVYDREERKVKLVSRRSGRNGAGADDYSFSPSISANGRYVAFETEADNLGGPRATTVTNIYVYDREERKVKLVSRRSGRNGAGADGSSFTASLSGKGRFVAFQTEADNLGGPLDTTVTNVYVYDREKRKVKLVSRRSRSQGGGGADDSSTDPFISANGRFVGFESNATNLGGPTQTDPLDGDSNVYVYDLERRRVELVSRRSQAAGGEGADDDSDDPVLSRDGRFVSFETNARNLGGPLANDPGDDSAYLYDRERKRVELVSRTTAGPGGDDDDEDPYVSLNGAFVAFEAESQNLGGPIDVSASNNIYVRIR